MVDSELPAARQDEAEMTRGYSCQDERNGDISSDATMNVQINSTRGVTRRTVIQGSSAW